MEKKNVNNNFNSHAHVERDLALPYYPPQDRISTHTLTWSVTLRLSSTRAILRISTHTLTWSVTAFQRELETTKSISTHTLTWSVTSGTFFFR